MKKLMMVLSILMMFFASQKASAQDYEKYYKHMTDQQVEGRRAGEMQVWDWTSRPTSAADRAMYITMYILQVRESR